jgi:hypothetical protein
MELRVNRIYDDSDATLGILFVDEWFECLTLEDEERTHKVFGETRIPRGRYKIGLRTVGGHHERYSKRYDFHIGMLQVLNVPNFEYILIHVGNTDDDTAGCLLVGETLPNPRGERLVIGSSRAAYEKLYVKVIAALVDGEDVYITYN